MSKTLFLYGHSLQVGCPQLGNDAPMLKEAAIGLAIRPKALTDSVPLQLLEHFLHQAARENCTCNLAPPLQLLRSSFRHHLKKLGAINAISQVLDVA